MSYLCYSSYLFTCPRRSLEFHLSLLFGERENKSRLRGILTILILPRVLTMFSSTNVQSITSQIAILQ